MQQLSLQYFLQFGFLSVFNKKNYGLVDIAWGLGMSVVGLFLIFVLSTQHANYHQHWFNRSVGTETLIILLKEIG